MANKAGSQYFDGNVHELNELAMRFALRQSHSRCPLPPCMPVSPYYEPSGDGSGARIIGHATSSGGPGPDFVSAGTLISDKVLHCCASMGAKSGERRHILPIAAGIRSFDWQLNMERSS